MANPYRTPKENTRDGLIASICILLAFVVGCLLPGCAIGGDGTMKWGFRTLSWGVEFYHEAENVAEGKEEARAYISVDERILDSMVAQDREENSVPVAPENNEATDGS